MYQFLLPKSKPAVEERYRLNLRERDVIFKLLHGILPTKSRLFQMKQNNSPLSPTCNVVEDNIHMFLKCKNIQNTLESFKLTLSNSCNIQNINLEKLFFFRCEAEH